MADTMATPEQSSEANATFAFFLPCVQQLYYESLGVNAVRASSLPSLAGSNLVITVGPSAVRVAPGNVQTVTIVDNSGTSGWVAQQAIQESTDWGKMFEKLDSLVRFEKGWDGYKAAPPNVIARDGARLFLESLSVENYSPSQVAPSVVGGIGVSFRRWEKKVYVEFNNNRKVHALFSDGNSPPEVRRVEPDAVGFTFLIRRMRAYLDEYHPCRDEANRPPCRPALRPTGIPVPTDSS